jgi:exodeoxyribonuclease V beta subunit
MGDANYHLQALLYTVALHRWLGARLGTSYRYDTHVGGHLYLFLRGMEGEQTPLQASGRRLGVYFDRWPRAVIEGLDLALRGASAESVTQHLQSLAAETGR